MLGLLRIALCVLSLAKLSWAAACDCQLMPELSFSISGHNIEWPCGSTKNIYQTNGRYVPKNIIATRTQIYKDQAIIAFPRLRPGVPFTLGTISLKQKCSHGSIAPTPFPCWSIQEEGTCEALQNVVDLVLDAHDYLWVLDTGIVNTLETPVRRCPPKVVGIDVKSGKVVKVIDLSSLVTEVSCLQYLVVDYANDGKVYLYISDAVTRAIIVYDVIGQIGFRVTLPKTVAFGSRRRGMLYMALIRKSYGSSVLYFTYLDSSRVYSIKASCLRHGTAGGAVVDVGPKQHEMVLLGTDNGSAIFFRYKGESEVYMWNTDIKLQRDNIIPVQKGNDCRLATHVVPGSKNLMWALESNFVDYLNKTIGCTGASIALHPLARSCDDF